MFSDTSKLKNLLGVIVAASILSNCAYPQQAPVIVQPGAPGQPSKTLPATTKPTLPPLSHADVAFMQGMIMHHSQAVEMTALITSPDTGRSSTCARKGTMSRRRSHFSASSQFGIRTRGGWMESKRFLSQSWSVRESM